MGHTSGVFQAIAHIYVGGLFGYWWFNPKRIFYFWIAVTISIIELICATPKILELLS